jgi:hypothetical protein
MLLQLCLLTFGQFDLDLLGNLDGARCPRPQSPNKIILADGEISIGVAGRGLKSCLPRSRRTPMAIEDWIQRQSVISNRPASLRPLDPWSTPASVRSVMTGSSTCPLRLVDAWTSLSESG